MTPSLLYQADLRYAAKPNGVPRRKYPLGAQSPIQFAAYAFDQDYTQQIAKFPPAIKNTPSNDASLGYGYDALSGNAILTSLTQPQHVGGGTGKFTGTFHIVPASWDDFITQSVSFPGIRDAAFTGGVRDPFSANVKTRLRYDYFVADPDGILSNLAGGANAVKDSAGQPIKLVTGKGAIQDIYRDIFKFVVSGAIQESSSVNSLVKAGGVPGYFETLPNTGTYQKWCENVIAFNALLTAAPPAIPQAWDATHPPAWDNETNALTVGQYQFSDSRIGDYAGNIFVRITEFVLAQ